MPTLILHGDDDQIVPIGASAMLSSKLVKGATLKVYPVDPDLYYSRPIAVRNPIVFYEGHLPGFALNALVKKGLKRPGIDARLEHVFARGIDPESQHSAQARHGEGWPTREEVAAFVAAADAAIEDALLEGDIEVPGVPIIVPRGYSRSSSTKRCTRRRYCICGIGCLCLPNDVRTAMCPASTGLPRTLT